MNNAVGTGTISVLIPAYNEEGNVATLTDQLAEVLQTTQYEIVYIDDGSSDRTLERVREAMQRHPQITS